jgi:hypothetical protein
VRLDWMNEPVHTSVPAVREYLINAKKCCLHALMHLYSGHRSNDFCALTGFISSIWVELRWWKDGGRKGKGVVCLGGRPQFPRHCAPDSQMPNQENVSARQWRAPDADVTSGHFYQVQSSSISARRTSTSTRSLLQLLYILHSCSQISCGQAQIFFFLQPRGTFLKSKPFQGLFYSAATLIVYPSMHAAVARVPRPQDSN